MNLGVCMITMDRSPKENFLEGTLERFARSGGFQSPRLAFFNLFETGAPGGDPWATKILERLPIETNGKLNLIIPERRMLPCENAGRALFLTAEAPVDFVLFLEDDLDFCADFVGSVARWLNNWATSSYPLFAFGAAYDMGKDPIWLYPINKFYGTQALAMLPHNARSAGHYLMQNHPVNGVTAPGAYDLMLHDWARANFPQAAFFAASNPSFVQHLGANRSSLRDSGSGPTFPFAGTDWQYPLSLPRPRR